MPKKKTKAGSKPVAKAEPVKAKPVAKQENDNLWGAVCYFFGVLALVVFVMKDKSKFLKFHAMQSALLNVAWFAVFILLAIVSTVLAIVTIPIGGIGGLAWFCVAPIGLVVFVAVLYGAWKAYEGEMYYMPFLGEYAEKYSK